MPSGVSLGSPTPVLDPQAQSLNDRRSEAKARYTAAHNAFVDGIEPRPRAAESFAAYFTGASQWWTLRLDANTSSGAPGSSPVEAGKPFVVSYGRTLADLGESGTLASIKLHYRLVDDKGQEGPVTTLPITDGTRAMNNGQLVYLQPTIPLPHSARGELQYWFELTKTDRTTVWDSDFGRNHRAPIVPAFGAVVRFDEAWNVALSQPIKAGGALRLAYDVDRLKQWLRGTNVRGAESWNITAHVSFNDGPAQSFQVTIPRRGEAGTTIPGPVARTYSELVPWEVAVPVPKDARKVALWFEGSAYGGSVFGGNAFDSNFGNNWEFQVWP